MMKRVTSSSEFEDLWVPSRDQWSSKADYLLSIIGYAVGLGNFWRFPYLVYKNGGGAFVIPYVIMLAIVGMPLFFLECSRGQFSSSGPISAWKVVPLLQGVGVSKIIVSAFVTLYYNCIIAYSIYYFFASLQFPLPWSKCFDWWNAEETCSNNLKGVIYNITLDNSSHKLIQNATCINGTEVQLTQYSSAEYYWNQIVLQRSNSINETGGIIWDLALCLLLAWLIVLLILCKGIKSSGKIAYFTATFPYLILLILLVRGVTLEGARSGIDFYIGKESDFSKLTQAEVWKDACCTNTSVALGDLTSLSSFNKFNNNCYRDAIIITSVNSITSLLAGFANFAILGHMAFQQQKTVKQVAESGLGLIFIAYPNGLALLPISSFWSVFFFFMLITLGINSQFVMIETIVATIKEELPQMKFKFLHVLIIICVSLYLFGLLLIAKAGIYWIELIDTFSTGWNILLVGFLELVGGNQFIKDIEMMIGKKNWLFWSWWRLCWFYVSPIMLLAIILWTLATFQPPQHGNMVFPTWSIIIGWLIMIFSMIWIPIIATVKIFHAKGSNLYMKFVATCKPTPDWGPLLKVNRGERYKNQIDSK